MHYISTRDNAAPETAAGAILKGMVTEGGLFVPENIPRLEYTAAVGKPYAALAAEGLGLYLGDYSAVEIARFTNAAYAPDTFPPQDVVPLHHLDNGVSVLELWHGPTAAFKDVALQLLPYLLTAAAEKRSINREIVILVATSGDTGKAALEGFRDIPGTRIIVFYPEDGVSDVQKQQMVTTAGDNTAVVSVKGNFDDCQNMVKDMFAESALAAELDSHGFAFSSANSINWGRLVPQIVYYYAAYAGMLQAGRIKAGDPLNFVVPTGNFGNILAAWYAMKMGLPVGRLICASNKNKILHDFFSTGSYNANRMFFQTVSPSMDILISSNLERFLYHLGGAVSVNRWYRELGSRKSFTVDGHVLGKMTEIIAAGSADEAQTHAEIARIFSETGYLIDPHTAVAMHVGREYREQSGDTTPAVVDATASPFKFNKAVYSAIRGASEDDEFVLIDKLAEASGTAVHRSLSGLQSLPVRHTMHCTTADGREAVRQCLGIGK